MATTTFRKLGSSRYVIIPKPLLAQAGITDGVEMNVENGAIVLRPPGYAPREGWAKASREIAAATETLARPEFVDQCTAAPRW